MVAVSAVIPVHNGAAYVADAITSVLSQTLPVSECIVVDDGSADATADVVRSFGHRITVIRLRRGGVSTARNTGMNAAAGDLIAFLDADDLWLPDKLERQVAAMEASGASASCTGYGVARPGRRWHRVIRPTPRVRVEGAVAMDDAGLGFAFTGVVTRCVAGSVGGFDPRLSASADLDFAWRVSLVTPMLGVPEPLAVYREHGTDQMHRDLHALEHDMIVLLARGASRGMSGAAVRRARANVETYRGIREILSRDPGGFRALTAAARNHPARLLLHPLRAGRRRLNQHVHALADAPPPSLYATPQGHGGLGG